MATSKTLLFFGNERLATGVTTDAPILRMLVQSGYDVKAVVVAETHTHTGSRSERQLEIVKVAEQHNIEVIRATKLLPMREQLQSYGAGAAVLVAFGKIIPSAILELFEIGIINVHPSLLPQHRGPTPLESVLLSGESTTGISLMKLVAAMDAGPVYAQKEVPIPEGITKQLLANQLAAEAAAMLQSNLEAILDGSLIPVPQVSERATYDALIHKNDGLLTSSDWNGPGEVIIRKLAAYAEWPKVKLVLGDVPITLKRAHLVPKSHEHPGTVLAYENQLAMALKHELLILDELVPAGKQTMSGTAFLAGYKNKLNL